MGPDVGGPVRAREPIGPLAKKNEGVMERMHLRGLGIGIGVLAMALAACASETGEEDASASGEPLTPIGGQINQPFPRTTTSSTCVNGLSKTMQAVSPDPARRCSTAQVAGVVQAQCQSGGNSAICEFLQAVVAKHGQLQCTYDVATKSYCVDVVDRLPSGAMLDQNPDPIGDSTYFYKNYFIAFGPEQRVPIMSPSTAVWDAALQKPAFLAPPVELSHVGFTDGHSIAKDWINKSWNTRIFKFDPRTCSGCSGNYPYLIVGPRP